MSNVRIIHGDSLEAMKAMPDKAYDLAIVDPPYGIGDFKNSCNYSRKPYNVDWKIEWNDAPPSAEYFKELYRVSENAIIWGANYYSPHIRDVGRIFWDKLNSSNIGSDGEIASQFKDKRVIKYTLQNIGFIGPEKGQKIHPCQKPVALYQWLLKNYAKPGDRILDTHGGSCSIAIACDIMGFDADIWEIDAYYYRAAVERFERHKQQTVLEFSI